MQVTECVTTRSKQNLCVLHLAFLLIPTEWVWSFYTGLQVYCPDQAVQNANYACTSGGLNFKLNVCKRMCTIAYCALGTIDLQTGLRIAMSVTVKVVAPDTCN